MPRRLWRREFYASRRSAPAQSATRGTARTRFAANRVQGTPMCACRSARLKKIAEARAHWVGSAYRSSSLGLAVSFRSRPHGGACDRQEVSAKASEQPHTSPSRTDGDAGRRADRVRRTWRGRRSGSLRAGRGCRLPRLLLQCDERERLVLLLSARRVI